MVNLRPWPTRLELAAVFLVSIGAFLFIWGWVLMEVYGICLIGVQPSHGARGMCPTANALFPYIWIVPAVLAGAEATYLSYRKMNKAG